MTACRAMIRMRISLLISKPPCRSYWLPQGSGVETLPLNGQTAPQSMDLHPTVRDLRPPRVLPAGAGKRTFRRSRIPCLDPEPRVDCDDAGRSRHHRIDIELRN